jgi:hypothetical protein
MRCSKHRVHFNFPGRLDLLACGELHGSNSKIVTVTEKQYPLAFPDSSLRGLNPLAPPGAVPQTPEEAQRSTLDIRAVVLAHDGLDRLGCLIGIVEWDGRDVVVKHVSLDDTVEQSATNKSKFTVNRCGGTTDVVPARPGVVGKSWVGVLEEGDSNCLSLVMISSGIFTCHTYQASGSPRGKGGSTTQACLRIRTSGRGEQVR